jgi:phosphopantetheinyl transferase/3-hydroxymyristoyl/3-hydroxydecanoyl-(acyl carrier protein) dehydratase
LAMWSAIEAREASTRPGLIAFSSIAGRFGNVGQIDYSAANEVCARLVSSVQRAGGRAMVLDWTAWADVGMASRGSMPEILTSRGVEFLPVEVGAQWPAMLWGQGATGEFLIAGSLGEMGGLEEVSSQGKSEAIEGLPLIDRVTRHGARQVEVRRTLDVATDRFMRDHVYEGVPLMPGVMGLELMLEAAQALVGEGFGVSDEMLHIKDVKFERALKLHRGEPAQVIARATREPGEVEIHVQVLTRRTTKTGREVEQQHYTSSVLAVPELEVSGEPLTCNPTVGAWKRGPQREEIYQRFFHERTFQVIDEIPAWCERAIIGYGRLGDESLVAGRDDRMMSSDPLAREAAFQVMGLWGMMCDELSYLPHSIERDVSFGRVIAGERFVVRGVKGESGKEGILRFDRIEVCDEAGELLHIYEGVEMVGHQKLREDARFGAQFAAMWTSLRIDTVALDLWMGGRQVSDLIDESELPEHSRLISERRRNEWLCARLATKELARCWARDFFGAAWALNDFVVRKDEFGAPSLAARDGLQSMGPLPFITMSHSHGVAYAVISAPGEPAPIGVDIERIETREEAFARDYFTPEELALSVGEGVERDALITALWCCKESVSKALGLGLKLRMSDMIIERFAQDDVPGLVVKVTLRRDALEALHAQGSQGLEVRLFIESEFAVALARGVKREGLSRELDASQLTALAQILRQNGEALTARSASPEGRTQGVMWRH